MKLLYLYIEKYKNLEKVEIDFSKQDKNTTVLIGENGAGKSNLLEAIILIFENLYLYKYYTKTNKIFKYKIEYEINNERYRIDSSSISYFSKLPDNIIIYYSGFSSKMINICNRFDKYYFNKKSIYGYSGMNIDSKFTTTISPLLYIKNSYYPIVFVTLLLSKLEKNQSFLKKYFNINGFESIDIRLGERFFEPENEINNNNLLMYRAQCNQIFDLKIDFNDSYYKRSKDKLNHFFPNFLENLITINSNSKNELKKLSDFFEYDKDLFNFFYLLFVNKMISSIYIKIKKNNSDDVISCYDLSEGEKQLLTIKGMMEVLYDKETLFLLDEPDNFLHPKWQTELIPALQKYGDEGGKTQIISTSHSPIFLTRIKNDSIKRIENGKIFNLTSKTYGRMINQTLFDTMDVEERTVKEIKDKLNNLFIMIDDNKIDDAEKYLNEIIIEIGEDDPDIIRAKTMLGFLKDEE